MNKIFLHPNTELFVKSTMNTLPQSLLLSGQAGVGLRTLASHIADSSLSITVKPDTTKTSPIISVDAIRGLYTQSRTKTHGRRIVIIDDAEAMSSGAQAAFLKLLEEPNTSTYFILTTHSPSQLLPTIRSRVQHVQVQPLSQTQTFQFLDIYNVIEQTKRTQLLFLADGLPAELTRLIENPDYFRSRARFIGEARAFITTALYQKLQIIQRYRNDREAALDFIDSTIAVLRYSLQSKPQEALVKQLSNLLEAREKIAANQNIALQLAYAVL